MSVVRIPVYEPIASVSRLGRSFTIKGALTPLYEKVYGLPISNVFRDGRSTMKHLSILPTMKIKGFIQDEGSTLKNQ